MEYNSLLTTNLVSTCQDLSGLKFLDHFMSYQMVILGRPGKPDENQISNPGGPDLPAKSSKPPSSFWF